MPEGRIPQKEQKKIVKVDGQNMGGRLGVGCESDAMCVHFFKTYHRQMPEIR